VLIDLKMKICYSLLVFFSVALVIPSNGQMLSAKIGVNGLTCSMCTRSVEMSLSRLDFVDSVAMSLENTEGEIFFKQNVAINPEELAKAIVNAGFSVRFVKVQVDLNKIQLQENGSFDIHGQNYLWLDYKTIPGGESIWLTLVGDAFLPKAEMKTWKSKIERSANGSKRNIYHVSAQG
jgi:cation transport ATPase